MYLLVGSSYWRHSQMAKVLRINVIFWVLKQDVYKLFQGSGNITEDKAERM